MSGGVSTGRGVTPLTKRDLEDLVAKQGKPGGTATLGLDGKLSADQRPDSTIFNRVTVYSQSQMLALTSAQVQDGDVAIRADINRSFQLFGDPSQLSSWSQIENINLTTADVTEVGNKYFTDERAQAAVINDITAANNKAYSSNKTNQLLSDQYNTIQQHISDETAARQSADSALQNNINAEATARSNADSTLQNNINAEASARSSADSTLQSNINNEATARQNADSILQSNISSEASARSSADTTLQNNINAEATARQNADAGKVDKLNNQAGSVGSSASKTVHIIYNEQGQITGTSEQDIAITPDKAGLGNVPNIDATNLVNTKVTGTFTPDNNPIITSDTGKAIAQKAQGQLNARLRIGALASRPDANAVASNPYYMDETGIVYSSNGTVWTKLTLNKSEIDLATSNFSSIFVDSANGSDTTGTGSRSSPFQTIQAAINSFTAGAPKVIYVKGSTTGSITFRPADQSMRIVYDPKSQHTGNITLVDGNTSIYFDSLDGSASFGEITINDGSKGMIYWNLDMTKCTYNKTGGGSTSTAGYVEFGIDCSLDGLFLNLTGNSTIVTYGKGTMAPVTQSAGIFSAQHNGAISGAVLSGTSITLFGNNIQLNKYAFLGSLNRSSNTVTCVSTSPHKLSVGDSIVIANSSDGTFNGTFTVATTPNSTTFTYAQTASNGSSISAVYNPRSIICTSNTGAVYIKGASTLQLDGVSYGKIDFTGAGVSMSCFVWVNSQLAPSGDIFPTNIFLTNSSKFIRVDSTPSNYSAQSSNVESHLSGIDTRLGQLASALIPSGGTPANYLSGDGWHDFVADVQNSSSGITAPTTSHTPAVSSSTDSIKTVLEHLESDPKIWECANQTEMLSIANVRNGDFAYRMDTDPRVLYRLEDADGTNIVNWKQVGGSGGGGGGGSTTLATLTDVNLASLQNGQYLRYNILNGKWENSTIPIALFTSLGILVQTTLGNYAARQIAVGSNKLTITNPDGILGNPTLDAPFAVKTTQGSSNPTINYDLMSGYDINSLHFNTTTKILWHCINNATGAAVWMAILGNNVFYNLQENFSATPQDKSLAQYNSTSGKWEDKNLIGQANGIAPLDANSKIAFSYLPTSLTGTLNFISTWNAATNTPTITSSIGNSRDYYIVQIAGTTTLNGNSTWSVGDLVLFDGSVNQWKRIQSSAVSSVNGKTGVVVLTTDDIAQGTTNKYYSISQAKSDLIQNAINSGTTDRAPSQDAVYNALQAKQSLIATGSVAQFLKGDGSLATFSTEVRGVVGTGLSRATNSETPQQIVNTDTLEAAINKLSGDVQFFKAVSQPAMLALTNVRVGDFAIRTDLDPIVLYRLSAAPATTLANWKQVGGSGSGGGGTSGSIMPIGSVLPFTGTIIPSDYVLGNRQLLSKVIYADLWQFAVDNGMTTTTSTILGKYLDVDSTNFRTPDFRGYFLRGYDSTGSVDPNGATREIGSVQADDFKSHRHSAIAADHSNNDASSQGWPATGHNSFRTSDRSGVDRTALIGNTGGLETRPKNISLNFIIKATKEAVSTNVNAGANYITKNFIASTTVPLPTGASQINEFVDSFDGVTKWKNNLGVVYPAPDGQVLQPDNIEFAVKLSVVATSGQVVLSWQARPEDIQYKIYYGTLGSSINLTGSANFTDSPPTTSRTITGLTNGTQYEFYMVRITKPSAGKFIATPGASLANFLIDSADGSSGSTGATTVSYNQQSGTLRYDLIYEQTSNASFTNPQIVQGTTALSITKTGLARYGSNIAITSAVRSNNITTVTTTTAHGLSLSTNRNINISGANESEFNGEGFIIMSIPSSTTFTYYNPGANQTATGTVIANQNLPYIWMVRAGSGDTNMNVSSMVRASSVTTITTATAHSLVAGRIITISGANESSFNGNWVVLNVINTTQFTITNAGANQTATGTITATTNVEISRTSIVSQEVSSKYFAKVYNPNTVSEFVAWSCKDPNNSYAGEAARSPNYYKNPTSYSDALFTNTKYNPIVYDYIRIRVRPRSTFAAITVAGNFSGSVSRGYGSVFELTDGHKTADQMTFDSLTNVFNVANDNMDSYAMENDGGAIVSNVNSTDMSLTHFMKITRALGNSTTAISQNDKPTISAFCRMAVFLAANNGSNRGIKVFVDLTNQRLAWINGGATYNVAFSTLGMTLGSTSSTVYVIGDQINELHIGDRSTQVAYVCEFNWNTNTVVKRNATAMPLAEFRYGTQEDEFGELLYTVNGKNFYFKSIVIDSATLGATRTVRWTMVGDLDNPFNGTEVFHNVTFTPLNTNLTANNFTWGAQGGIDYMGIIESSSGTNRLYMMDWGHDSASLFTQNDNDQTMGMVRTNIFYIANGNGVI